MYMSLNFLVPTDRPSCLRTSVVVFNLVLKNADSTFSESHDLLTANQVFVGSG